MFSRVSKIQQDASGAQAKSVREFRTDIQGIRAIAVLLVISEHARWGLSGGFTGVDIFFVISGFVIMLSLLRGLEESGRVKFGSFYKRRIFRLMPVATIVTLVTSVVAIFLVSPLGLQQQAAATGGAALLWISNIALYLISSDYFNPHVQANPFLHTWSLGVEEQFYVFFPLLIVSGWILGRKTGLSPRRMITGAVVTVGVGSFALSLATSMGNTLEFIPNPDQFAFYMMPTRAWEFAVGVLIALGLSKHKTSSGVPKPVAISFVASGLVLIILGSLLITQSMHFPGYAALIPVAGTALVIVGGMRKNPVSQLLAFPPLRWLGDRSYSLYLWHWPIMVFVRRIWPEAPISIVAAVILSVVLSDLTFRFVEIPCKRLGRDPLNWRRAMVPGAKYVVAGLSCIVLLTGSMAGWNIPRLQATADQLNERPVGYKDCLSVTLVSERNMANCTWGKDRPGKPIYLVGDSNAQQYTEALITASKLLERPLVIATWGGCAFFDSQMSDSSDPTKGEECSRYVRDGSAWLTNQPIGTVLMANAGTAITDADIALAGEIQEDAKADVWRRSLIDQLTDIQDAGHKPVLIEMTPHFPDQQRGWWHPSDCSNMELLNSPKACAAILSADELHDQRKWTLSAERAAAEAAGTHTMDPAPELCPAGNCTTFHDGLWLYRDGLHITPDQSSHMAEWFVSNIGRWK